MGPAEGSHPSRSDGYIALAGTGIDVEAVDAFVVAFIGAFQACVECGEDTRYLPHSCVPTFSAGK